MERRLSQTERTKASPWQCRFMTREANCKISIVLPSVPQHESPMSISAALIEISSREPADGSIKRRSRGIALMKQWRDSGVDSGRRL